MLSNIIKLKQPKLFSVIVLYNPEHIVVPYLWIIFTTPPIDLHFETSLNIPTLTQTPNPPTFLLSRQTLNRRPKCQSEARLNGNVPGKFSLGPRCQDFSPDLSICRILEGPDPDGEAYAEAPKQFDLYSEKGIRFVTRLKNNVCVEVLQELEVDEESVIEEDLIVRLGKGKNRMEHDLRLVITMDTKGKAVMILTNDFNITAEEIGVIYRYRWGIIQLIG